MTPPESRPGHDAPRSGPDRGRAGADGGRAAKRENPADRPIHQVQTDGRIVGEIRSDTPVFVISVAAELAGMHAQTLRSYDREGLVSPGRTSGGGRRYSQRDIELLQQVQQLSQDDGVNRAGIRRIMELEGEVDALRGTVEDLLGEISALRRELGLASGEQPTATHRPGSALVPWRATTTAVVTWRREDPLSG